LTLQTILLAADSNLSFALGSTTSDLLDVAAAGGMSLPAGGAGNRVTIKITGGAPNTTYHLIEFNGGANGGGLTLDSSNVNNYFVLDPAIAAAEAALSVSTSGPDSFVDIFSGTVPEPTGPSMLVLLAGVFQCRRRRRLAVFTSSPRR